MRTATDEMGQVAQYWNDAAEKFDSIYTGDKSAVARALDRWLRRDMYQRFDWVMKQSGDVRGKTVCDFGCGSGRFVAELAARGASHVTGIDIAPQMLKLAREVVAKKGVARKCSFELSDVNDWKGTDTYDVTIAIGFWDYIRDPASRLAVIRRATHGKFLSAWPRAHTARAAIRTMRLGVLGCPCYFYTQDDVYRHLQTAGFRVDNIEVLGQLHCATASAI